MKLSSENAFILNLLRGFLGKKDSQSDFQEGRLDWEEIHSIGKHQNLLPLFHHLLSRQKLSGDIPSGIRGKWEEAFFESVAVSLLYDELLKKILVSFSEKEIPLILLKGPSTAIEYYRPREVRPYADLDLLIKERDFERVRNLFIDSGFRVANPEGEVIRRKYFNSVTFAKKAVREMEVDLHWETLIVSWNKRPFLSSEETWQDIRWLELSGMKLPVLTPRRLILHLSLHLAFHHQFGRMLTLCDLDLIVQKFGNKIDWDEIVRESRTMKITKAVYYTLRLAATLLKTEVPVELLRTLRPNKTEAKLVPVLRFAFRKEPLSQNMERLVKLILIDNLRGKVLSLIAFLRQARAKSILTSGKRWGQ